MSRSFLLSLLFTLFTSSCAYTTMGTGTAAQRIPWTMMPATTQAPPRERTTRRTNYDTQRRRNDDMEDYDWRRDGPLEYLEDMELSREMDDPFHILLLGATFDKPKITVSYVSGSLEYVLDMPPLEATELSKFAEEHGMSCLGTWSREQCLDFGKKLQLRDIVCRVVPYTEGGQRGWQAKDANMGNGARSDSFN